MGHCEMLLAVAGLDDVSIREQTRRLVDPTWKEFSSAEQEAFAFAKTLSLSPWTLEPAHFRALARHGGATHAVQVAWWAARCQYMIRVADAFQLPLERENVFAARIADDRGRESRNTALPKP